MKLRRLLAVLPALGGAALCLALVVSIFAITVPIYLEMPSVAEITIANRSSEMIVGGAVEALGMSHPLSNIAAGERTTVSFPINGEGSYSVRAQLASGRTVDGGERYIASGFSVNDSVNVTNDKITIRSIRPFRVRLLMKDGSETLSPQITDQPLPERREVIDVQVDGRATRAMAHLLTWPDVTPSEGSARTPIVVAVETN